MIDLKKWVRKRNRRELERFVKVVYEVLLRRSIDSESLIGHVESLLDGMRPSQFIENIGTSEEFKLATGYSLSRNEIGDSSPSLEFIGNNYDYESVKRVIYFAPSIKREIGGIKVIVRHSEIINQISSEIISEVFFPQNINTKIHWFEHNAKIKTDALFDARKDFIIVPEIWSIKYGEYLSALKIRYGIFVQNGYDIFAGGDLVDDDRVNAIKIAYENATVILTISDDTTTCVSLAFPDIANKVIQLTTSIDTHLFRCDKKKENIISFMPRKLTVQSSWLHAQLKLLGDKNWEILPIVGLNEQSVAEVLSISKIFLSFSDREGLSLPPLEAALSGNLVIGYTGEGAEEYWHGNLFKKIESGNLINFRAELIKEMIDKKSDDRFAAFLNDSAEQISFLKKKYSSSEERIRISKFLTLLNT